MDVKRLTPTGLRNRIRTLRECIENAELEGVGGEVPLLRTQLSLAQAEAAIRTEVAVAANGHRMVYRLNSRTGEPIQHSAVCHPECKACGDGETLPDW